MPHNNRTKHIALAVVGIAAAILFGRLATVALTHVDRTATEQRNADNAVAFYEAAINRLDFERARAFVGATYIQHNPAIADGPDGLRAMLEQLGASDAGVRADIKRILAEGDYVALHVHLTSTAEPLGRAAVDIFRFDADGKVIEHWQVSQPVPAQAANDNGMF